MPIGFSLLSREQPDSDNGLERSQPSHHTMVLREAQASPLGKVLNRRGHWSDGEADALVLSTSLCERGGGKSNKELDGNEVSTQLVVHVGELLYTHPLTRST